MNADNDTESANVRAPGHFSETRFATYSANVLETFLHNCPYYYTRLNKEKDGELDNIDNAPFLLSCAGLSDV